MVKSPPAGTVSDACKENMTLFSSAKTCTRHDTVNGAVLNLPL